MSVFQIYADDVIKDYPKYPYVPATDLASLLGDFGSRSIPTAERLSDLLATRDSGILIQDDVNEDSVPDFGELFSDRAEDDGNSLRGQETENKLVSARAKRMGYMLPIGQKRFSPNYSSNWFLQGK